MVDVMRLLNSIGKKIFVNYYYDFKQVTDKKALAEKLLRGNSDASTLGGQLTRINCAIKIFENNLQLEALNIVVHARVDESTIEKAKELMMLEKA